MSEYLDRLHNTFAEITSGNFTEKLWAKIYKKDSISFRAKVRGIKSFIHFDQMPWTYSNIEYWNIIAPMLIGKAYEAVLIGSEAETKRLTLSVNHNTFSTKTYTRGQSYKCIILEKKKTFLIVEAGLDSNFKNGSQIGEISMFDFWQSQAFINVKIGDEIMLTYLKHTNQNILTMCEPTKYKEWYKQKPEQYVGSFVDVVVTKEDDESVFTVHETYNGILRIKPELYGEELIAPLNQYIQNLSSGDEINCYVQGINSKTNEFLLHIEPRLLEELKKI
jgi:ribosomal protein S1